MESQLPEKSSKKSKARIFFYHQPLRAGKVAGGGGLDFVGANCTSLAAGGIRPYQPQHHNLHKILILLPVCRIVPDVGSNLVV